MAQRIIESSSNPIFEQIKENLESFLDGILCLHDTYEYSEDTLKRQYNNSERQVNDFLKHHAILEENEYNIPAQYVREYIKLEQKMKRAEKAFTLIPPTYIVSLVSLYDTFYANIVRSIYTLCPQKLNESEMTFNYKSLQEYSSIAEIKDRIIETKIDSLLRDSHISQIDWLEKALHLKTLKKFKRWTEFVELTERRNLFVHSEGIVSSQYLSICASNEVSLSNIANGDKLSVDKTYFNSSFELLYEIGIMLTQILLHKLYIPNHPIGEGALDQLLITNIYDLISEKMYDIAIAVSEFALSPHFSHSEIDKSYIILNMAQAYKWSGDEKKCQEILSKIDSSTWNNELLIPLHTLREDYNKVYSLMHLVGANGKILSITAYRDWPIFQHIRKEPEFKNIFVNIFHEELCSQTPIVVDSLEKKKDTTSNLSIMQK